MWRHHADLASGKLTRVPSGGNLPPLEVSMSRVLGPLEIQKCTTLTEAVGNISRNNCFREREL